MLVNVCSGLFSGATIGVLTSIAQYRKIKTEYFASLFSLLKDYYKVFVVDEELLAKSITFLREHSFEEIRSCDGFKDFTEVNNDLLDRYNSCPLFSHSEYVSLNPFDKKSGQLLKQIDFDELKLDSVFMKRGIDVRRDDKLLQTIIELAKFMGMSVVQEGVETKELFDKVVAMGCDVIQGYYYAKAISLEEFKIFINTNTSIKYKSMVK